MVELSESEAMTVWVGATRYYIGRRSYAVAALVDALIRHWPTIPADVRAIIRRDVTETVFEDDIARLNGWTQRPLGQDIDRAQWLRVLAL